MVRFIREADIHLVISTFAKAHNPAAKPGASRATADKVPLDPH